MSKRKPEPTFFDGQFVLRPAPPSDCDNTDKAFIHSPGLDFLPTPAKPRHCPWLRLTACYALEPDETVLRTNAVMLPTPGSLEFLDAYHLNLGQADYLAHTRVAPVVRPLVRAAASPLLAEADVLAARWLGALRAELDEELNLPAATSNERKAMSAPLISILSLTIDLSRGRYRRPGDDVCALSLCHGTGTNFRFLRSYGALPDGTFETEAPYPGSLPTTKPWAEILSRWEKSYHQELKAFLSRSSAAVMEMEAAARAATTATP